MTYDIAERSAEGGQPTEIYTWTVGNNAVAYRLTSAPEDVVVTGQTFTAIAISRGSIENVQIGNARELDVTMPIAHPLAQTLLGNGIPPRDVLLTIERYHPGTAIRQIWKGYVASCSAENQYAKLRVPNSTDREFSVRLPIATARAECNHDLYDPGCTINRDYGTYATQGWMVAATVVSQTGTTLVVSNMNNSAAVAHPYGWATLGEVRRILDGERRSIISHTGTTLVLDVPFGTIAAGNELEVYAGCDHTVTTCKTKFANAINFGGWPNATTSNPYGSWESE